MTALTKEVCKHCCKSLYVGQAIVECSECNHVIHHQCYNSTNTDSHGNFLCNICVNLAVKRYNPFKYDIFDEEIDLDETTTKLSVEQLNQAIKQEGFLRLNTSNQ